MTDSGAPRKANDYLLDTLLVNDLTRNDLARVEAKVDDLATKVDDLLIAWNTARGALRFVKLMGGLAAAVAAFWSLVKLGKAP